MTDKLHKFLKHLNRDNFKYHFVNNLLNLMDFKDYSSKIEYLEHLEKEGYINYSIIEEPLGMYIPTTEGYQRIGGDSSVNREELFSARIRAKGIELIDTKRTVLRYSWQAYSAVAGVIAAIAMWLANKR